MIGIVDYGMGNLGSVFNACRFLELEAEIIDSPDALSRCEKVILPGQGAFGDCMRTMNEAGFTPAIKQWIADDKPLFGVCIGLQVLFEGSEESPGVDGFGILPGVLKRFDLPRELKVPQMGWNKLNQRHPAPMFESVPDGSHFYFVHSFYAEETDADWACGQSDYGLNYTSAIARGNLQAVQFHPEKSQAHGLQMLRNFGQAAATVS